MRKKEIKTRKELIERLNAIDKKCIDEGLHFHDLKTLFESNEHKLTAEDRTDIKKVASVEEDPETLKAYIDAKVMEEDYLLEDEEDYNYGNYGFSRKTDNADLDLDDYSPEDDYGDNLGYRVSAYYDEKLRELEDDLNTNDYSEALDFVWEKCQEGLWVEILNTETGDSEIYSPDKFDEDPIDPSDLRESKDSSDDIVYWVEKAEDYINNKIKKFDKSLYIDDIKWGKNSFEIPIYKASEIRRPFGDEIEAVFNCYFDEEDFYGSKEEQLKNQLDSFFYGWDDSEDDWDYYSDDEEDWDDPVYESLKEDINTSESDEYIVNYAKDVVSKNISKLKNHVTKSYNNYVKEYGKSGAIDTLKYIYFYTYLHGDEESFDNDDYLYSLIYKLNDIYNSDNKLKDFADYLWYYVREYVREYFSKKYLNKEYTIKELNTSSKNESLKENINTSDINTLKKIIGSFGVKVYGTEEETPGLITLTLDAEGYREVEETLDREIFNAGFDIVDNAVGTPSTYTQRETIKLTFMKDESEEFNEEIAPKTIIANKPNTLKDYDSYKRKNGLYHWFDNKEYEKDLMAAKPDSIPKGKKLMRDPLVGWVFIDDKEVDEE